MKNLLIATIFASILFIFSSCKKDQPINIFSIQEDIMLGKELRDTILAQPQTYRILDRSEYKEAYAFLGDIVEEILNTSGINYREEFAWETYILRDDETLNAFVAPGGYIYVYTGLIKYLEQKDDFAGVLGHEIAHADRRHSTNQLTEQYGVQTLLGVVFGSNPGLLGQVLNSLVTLKFSRDNESDADKYSVVYLCETQYAANGAASFFEKITASGGSSTPEFLSTHPSPENRVEDINKEAKDRGCDTTFDSSQSEWEAFQNSLP